MMCKYGPGGEFESDWYMLLYIQDTTWSATCTSTAPTDPPIVRLVWRVSKEEIERTKSSYSLEICLIATGWAITHRLSPTSMDRHLRQIALVVTRRIRLRIRVKLLSSSSLDLLPFLFLRLMYPSTLNSQKKGTPICRVPCTTAITNTFGSWESFISFTSSEIQNYLQTRPQ